MRHRKKDSSFLRAWWTPTSTRRAELDAFQAPQAMPRQASLLRHNQNLQAATCDKTAVGQGWTSISLVLLLQDRILSQNIVDIGTSHSAVFQDPLFPGRGCLSELTKILNTNNPKSLIASN